MRTLKLTEITGSLSDLAREGLREPVVVTRRGKPVLALVPLDREIAKQGGAGGERLQALIERSRRAHPPGTGFSTGEVRRLLGLRRRSG